MVGLAGADSDPVPGTIVKAGSRRGSDLRQLALGPPAADSTSLVCCWICERAHYSTAVAVGAGPGETGRRGRAKLPMATNAVIAAVMPTAHPNPPAM